MAPACAALRRATMKRTGQRCKPTPLPDPVLMTQAARPPAVDVWLATPDAARQFDPSKLSLEDRAEWDALRTERRRLDWASSRALLGVVPVAANQAGSLSHSHGFAALARAPGHLAVGVDVEWLAPTRLREHGPHGVLDGRGRRVRVALGSGGPARTVLRKLDAEGGIRQGAAPVPRRCPGPVLLRFHRPRRNDRGADRPGTGGRPCSPRGHSCGSPWSSWRTPRRHSGRARPRWSGRPRAQPTGPSCDGCRVAAAQAKPRASLHRRSDHDHPSWQHDPQAPARPGHDSHGPVLPRARTPCDAERPPRPHRSEHLAARRAGAAARTA